MKKKLWNKIENQWKDLRSPPEKTLPTISYLNCINVIERLNNMRCAEIVKNEVWQQVVKKLYIVGALQWHPKIRPIRPASLIAPHRWNWLELGILIEDDLRNSRYDTKSNHLLKG